jgi:hypothetical protein
MKTFLRRYYPGGMLAFALQAVGYDYTSWQFYFLFVVVLIFATQWVINYDLDGK